MTVLGTDLLLQGTTLFLSPHDLTNLGNNSSYLTVIFFIVYLYKSLPNREFEN